MTADHNPESPLLDEHRALGATFTDFAGWAMPLKYGSELAEHRSVRQSAGLFDLSHMGEIAVSGSQSAEALDFALIRPGCLAGAAWLLRPLAGGVWLGLVAGKAVADVIWYGAEASVRRAVA